MPKPSFRGLVLGNLGGSGPFSDPSVEVLGPRSRKFGCQISPNNTFSPTDFAHLFLKSNPLVFFVALTYFSPSQTPTRVNSYYQCYDTISISERRHPPCRRSVVARGPTPSGTAHAPERISTALRRGPWVPHRPPPHTHTGGRWNFVRIHPHSVFRNPYEFIFPLQLLPPPASETTDSPPWVPYQLTQRASF